MSRNRRKSNSNSKANKSIHENNTQTTADKNAQTSAFLDNLKKSYDVKQQETAVAEEKATVNEIINSEPEIATDNMVENLNSEIQETIVEDLNPEIQETIVEGLNPEIQENVETEHHSSSVAERVAARQAAQKPTGFGVVTNFVKRFYKYLISLALFAVMVVVVIVFGKKFNYEPENKPTDITDEPITGNVLDEEFKIDAYPEINTLIETYYQNYALGDADGVEMLANPVSDTEKSYIAIISQFTDSHENIHCYTKPGLNPGDYLVLATSDTKFTGIDTLAPGSELFYVTTDADGTLYIDNPYSTFNQANMQNSTQADIQSIINQFEDKTDVIEIETEIQEKYSQAISSDPELEDMVTSIIPNAITAWGQALIEEDDVPEEDPNAPTKDTEVMDTKTVYTTATINIRSGRGTSYRKLGIVDEGTELQMIKGSNENGWVMIIYNDEIGYVMKDYLKAADNSTDDETTTEEPAETPAEETTDTNNNENTDDDQNHRVITVNSAINIRSRMTTDSEKMGTTEPGDKVTIIMDYAEGWTKVKWKKKTGYIRTDLLG